jgi:hypothetical protein
MQDFYTFLPSPPTPPRRLHLMLQTDATGTISLQRTLDRCQKQPKQVGGRSATRNTSIHFPRCGCIYYWGKVECGWGTGGGFRFPGHTVETKIHKGHSSKMKPQWKGQQNTLIYVFSTYTSLLNHSKKFNFLPLNLKKNKNVWKENYLTDMLFPCNNITAESIDLRKMQLKKIQLYYSRRNMFHIYIVYIKLSTRRYPSNNQ